MVSKPSRSLFNRIFSPKKRFDALTSSDALDAAGDLSPVDEVVADREFSTTIQPPRLRRLEEIRLEKARLEEIRLEEIRSAQIQAYRDSLDKPTSDAIVRSEQFGVMPEDDGAEAFDVKDDFSGVQMESEESEIATWPVSRLRRDRRKARKRARARARRKISMKARLSGIGIGAARGAGRGILWTGALLQRQSKAVCDRVYPFIVRRRWTFILTGIIALTVGTGSAAVWWLSKVPPVADCGKISSWSPDNQQLYCAQVASQSGNVDAILKGIKLVKGWDKLNPLYAQASQSLAVWSDQLMAAARDRLDKQDLDGAIALAQQIPQNSPIYKDTREEIAGWQEARKLGQKLYDKIQVALKNQNWDEASGYLAKLATISDSSWQKRITEIRNQFDAEKAAGVVFKQAQKFARSNKPEDLGRAIAMTDPINRQTFVWQAALKNVDQWRNQVFDLAIVQLLQKKNSALANTLITSIPSNIALTPEQNQFAQLAQAYDVLDQGGLDFRVPLLQQMGRLVFANQLLAQIPSDSRFGKDAAALRPKLDQRSDDVVRLETARATADFGTLPLIQSAIAQAQQIGPKHPSRIMAQTFVAQWRKSVERLEDAPLIEQGEKLAKLGTIEKLNAAATLMQTIGKERALYADAQRQKNAWIAQAQIIEDQPILRLAKSQAASGQLSQAIQTARKIGSSRALYGDAQRSIGDWGDELQAIVDRATMERAAALAERGNLTQAIDTASAVSSNSVYREAQSSISQWSSERATIRRARAAETAEPRRDPEPQRDPEPFPPGASPTIAPESPPLSPVRSEPPVAPIPSTTP
jgi:hypothetical protein